MSLPEQTGKRSPVAEQPTGFFEPRQNKSRFRYKTIPILYLCSYLRNKPGNTAWVLLICKGKSHQGI